MRAHYPVGSPLGKTVANWIVPADTSFTGIAFRMGSPTVFGSGIISGIASTGFHEIGPSCRVRPFCRS